MKYALLILHLFLLITLVICFWEEWAKNLLHHLHHLHHLYGDICNPVITWRGLNDWHWSLSFVYRLHGFSFDRKSLNRGLQVISIYIYSNVLWREQIRIVKIVINLKSLSFFCKILQEIWKKKNSNTEER